MKPYLEILVSGYAKPLRRVEELMWEDYVECSPILGDNQSETRRSHESAVQDHSYETYVD